MHVVLVKVHEPDAVREILREADEIAADLTNGAEDYARVFEKAVDLLAARVQVMPQALPPLPVALPPTSRWTNS